MPAFAGRTALVTGASKGIGYHIARLCAHEGADLILVARDTQRLERVAQEMTECFPVNAAVFPADLSQPESAGELWQRVQAGGHNVDILVNNAGVGAYGEFREIPPEKTRGMRHLNIVSFTELMHLAAIEMARREWGRILTVASVAGFQAMPYMAEYAATKAYVLSLSEALRVELAPFGVVVTCLAPGPTDTDFFAAAGTRMLDTPGRKTPEEVARAGFRAMLRGRSLVVPGAMNKMMVFAGRLVPRALFAAAAARVLRRR